MNPKSLAAFAISHEALLPQSQPRNSANLDTTALLLLTSEVSHNPSAFCTGDIPAKPRSAAEWIKFQAGEELSRSTATLTELLDWLKECHQVVASETVVAEFTNIIATIAGPAETARARALTDLSSAPLLCHPNGTCRGGCCKQPLVRVRCVTDDITLNQVVPTTKRLQNRHKILIATGISYDAFTVTR